MMRLSSRRQLWGLLAFAYVARLLTLGAYPLTDTMVLGTTLSMAAFWLASTTDSPPVGRLFFVSLATMARNILPTYVLPGLAGFGLLVADVWAQRRTRERINQVPRGWAC